MLRKNNRKQHRSYVQVGMNESEKKAIEQMAKSENRSVSNFILNKIIGQSEVIKATEEDVI